MKDSPRVLVAGGLEPSGRAGVLADWSTVHELGATPLAVATTLTAQGSHLFKTSPVAPRLLAHELEALLELGPIHVVKLGVVSSRAQLAVMRATLADVVRAWVVDPVVWSSRQERLSRLVADDYRSLATMRCVLTPNLSELAWLLGRRKPFSSVHDSMEAARELIDVGFVAVVVKGGHARGQADDLVMTQQGAVVLRGERVRRSSTVRGSGCRFASALAVFLGQGLDLVSAARAAKRYVSRWLRAPHAKDARRTRRQGSRHETLGPRRPTIS